MSSCDYTTRALEVARVIEGSQRLEPLLERVRREPSVPRASGAAFTEQSFDLGGANAAAGVPFQTPGRRLRYLREGSSPGGRLTIAIGGARLGPVAPGFRLDVPFDRFDVVRHDLSAQVGTARLLVVANTEDDVTEPETATGLPFEAASLLGDVTVPTFVTVAEDTQPSGAAPTGSFLLNGYTQFALLIDTLSAGANATSFDLIPWFRERRSATWYEQGTERIAVPDSDSSGYRYRLVRFDWRSGDGRGFFEVRNLLAAARTSLGFVVLGIG